MSFAKLQRKISKLLHPKDWMSDDSDDDDEADDISVESIVDL